MRLIRAACQRGVAGVVVTHDAQLASWADRVVFLRDGRVVDQTAPAAGPESLLAPQPMSVAVRRPPGPGCRRRRTGGAPARRAVIRWAWRMFRREWRRQVLVLALLTVAVAATTVGLGVVVQRRPARGRPDVRHGQHHHQPPRLRPAAERRRRRPPGPVRHRSTWSPIRRVAVPGSVSTVDLRGREPRTALTAA